MEQARIVITDFESQMVDEQVLDIQEAFRYSKIAFDDLRNKGCVISGDYENQVLFVVNENGMTIQKWEFNKYEA